LLYFDVLNTNGSRHNTQIKATKFDKNKSENIGDAKPRNLTKN